MSGNDNPGNFANRTKEDVQNVASKGGQTGTENSGFASMPKEQVVRPLLPSLPSNLVLTVLVARDRLAGRQGQQRQLREG